MFPNSHREKGHNWSSKMSLVRIQISQFKDKPICINQENDD
jgi:hypothetical protein